MWITLQKIIKNYKNNKILKSQQRFRIEKHNVFTVKVNNIALSANNDKRIQSIDSVETFIWNKQRNNTQKKEMKCNNMIKQYKK